MGNNKQLLLLTDDGERLCYSWQTENGHCSHEPDTTYTQIKIQMIKDVENSCKGIRYAAINVSN